MSTRGDWIVACGGELEAIEAENNILSIGDQFLSAEARAVRDGEVDEPSSEYWDFLLAQTNTPEVLDAHLKAVVSTIEWNQIKAGNVHVLDGVMGFWAEFPEGVTAREALDEYMAFADYSGATRSFRVTATVLAGANEGQMASTTYEPEDKGRV
jgi:hypothetical protein